MKVSRWVVAGLMAGVAVAVPASAQAVSVLFSYEGSDYSWNSSTGKAVYAVDREADNHDVAVDYYKQGSSVEYSAQTQGGSGATTSRALDTLVNRHRSVELIPYVTDDYGPWKYPR